MQQKIQPRLPFIVSLNDLAKEIFVLIPKLFFSFQYLSMLLTKVKVGKVTNLSDARYCAGMGVDYLSFPISAVSQKMYREITAWVAGPKFGIKVDSEDPELIEAYDADFIEMTIDQFSQFSGDRKLIVTLSTEDWPKKKMKLMQAKERILYLELASTVIEDPVLKIIEEMAEDFKILVNHCANFNFEILKPPIAGISLQGDPEASPGLKEYPLSKILERLEAAD